LPGAIYDQELVFEQLGQDGDQVDEKDEEMTH
jgi:hypothetical protein